MAIFSGYVPTMASHLYDEDKLLRYKIVSGVVICEERTKKFLGLGDWKETERFRLTKATSFQLERNQVYEEGSGYIILKSEEDQLGMKIYQKAKEALGELEKAISAL